MAAVAEKSGLLIKGGVPDMSQAADFILQSYRRGRLGRWTVDNVVNWRPEGIRVDDEQALYPIAKTIQDMLDSDPAYRIGQKPLPLSSRQLEDAVDLSVKYLVKQHEYENELAAAALLAKNQKNTRHVKSR